MRAHGLSQSSRVGPSCTDPCSGPATTETKSILLLCNFVARLLVKLRSGHVFVQRGDVGFELLDRRRERVEFALLVEREIETGDAESSVQTLLVEPVQSRLRAALDDTDDPDELSTTVRAVYRECRSRRVGEAARFRGFSSSV